MDSLSLSGRRNHISKTSGKQLSLPALNGRRVGKLIERSLLPFAALMAVGLCLSEKPMPASLSVASAAAVTSEINRKRNNELLQKREQSDRSTINVQQHIINNNRAKFDSLYESYQKQSTEFNNIKQSFYDVTNKFQQIATTSTQLEQQLSEKNFDRTRLTHTIRKTQQHQRHLQKLELGIINSLSRDTEELKQQLEKIENIVATQQKQLLNGKNVSTSLSSNHSQISHRAKIPNRPVDDRVIIFIDEANLHITAREKGYKIDYGKLFAVLKDKSADCQAIVYVATDPKNQKQPAFLSRLKKKGFQIASKPVVKREDGSVKGNLDMEIGLGLVNSIDSYDTAVLISGDADFVCAVNQSRSYGKRVEVASFRTNTSASLIKAADSYLNLETIKEQIC